MNIEPVERATVAPTAPAAGPVRAAPDSTVAAKANAAQEAAARAAAERAASEQLRRAMAEAGRRLAEKGSELTFEFDEDVQQVIVKLVDTRTREVLRQIPSDEALAIARALRDGIAAGALLRASA